MSLLDTSNLATDERKLLLRSHFNFNSIKKDRGGLDLAGAFRRTLPLEAVYVLALVACASPWWALTVPCALAAACFVGLAFAGVFAIAYIARCGEYHWGSQRPSVIYWAWWPCFELLFCIAALIAGVLIGRYLYWESFHPYFGLRALQRYNYVDPTHTVGEQVQDAGLVTFAPGVGIDRARGGCFMAQATTYCVAPILPGGHVSLHFADQGSHDFFAVGRDCCNCPNQDFKCGEWDNPIARGGLRSLDEEARPFYRLAVDEYNAAYSKVSKHPMFFDWVQEPAYEYNRLFSWGTSTLLLAATVPVPAVMFLMLILSAALGALVRSGIASPACVPQPPQKLLPWWEIVLPEMKQRYIEETRQLLAMPVGPAPNYGAAPQSQEPAAAAFLPQQPSMPAPCRPPMDAPRGPPRNPPWWPGPNGPAAFATGASAAGQPFPAGRP